MSENTKIAWCDSTWNPWGAGAPRLRGAEASRFAPLKWNKKPWVCPECGGFFSDREAHLVDGEWCGGQPNPEDGWQRRRVFSLSLGDWLDPEIPVEWLVEKLDVIRRCPNLFFLLLSKRVELWTNRMDRAYVHARDNRIFAVRDLVWDWVRGTAPANVWLGTTVEDQPRADERIPALLKIPAAVRFLSVEPLLGELTLGEWLSVCPVFHSTFHVGSGSFSSHGWKWERNNMKGGAWRGTGLHWVIGGGESGRGARPCDIGWLRSLRDQCAAADVPFFCKQVGARAIEETFGHSKECDNDLCALSGGPLDCRGETSLIELPLHHPAGADPAEWPEDLRVRQLPNLP